ncbi:hypothetical protein SAMN05192530_101668 [Aureimonas jatrophae]|jgi:hypothetical protein|uniref:Uncharacterized protein n=2 Tax=Aureimonas jatrophae TaxID=1166073 RepID=A0A1H0D9W4_9HYPH|nr:hypothetical protein SAMN05192530_101668 [Aureimonas jatrophae]
MSRTDLLVRAASRGPVLPMSNLSTMAVARSGRTAGRRSARAATARNEGLRPAKGLLLGLGLSSLIWSALVALVVF